jgi:hypothetical protein
MAKTETTVKGYVYTVTSPNGGTVTDAEGKLNKPVDAGDQVTVTAPSDSLTCDDDDAVICKANFKSPLLALRLLGQGGNALPAGYTRAEFLESTGTQYVMTGFFPDGTSSISLDVKPVYAPAGLSIWVFANADAGRTEAGRAFKAAAGNGTLYLEFGSFDSVSGGNSNPPAPAFGIRRKMVLKNGLCNTGLETYEFPKQTFKDRLVELSLFRNIRDATVTTLDIYSCLLSKNGKTERYFVPALDAGGTPCMFDLVSKTAFKNSGTGHFVLGMTFGQASTLGMTLPDGGGDLYISLPAGWEQNSKVRASLALAAVRLWNIFPRTTEATSTASTTFALRRVWVRRVADPLGSYVAADGARWVVEWCEEVFSSSEPDELGFERFRSVDAAVAYWELQPYVDPNAEVFTT